MNPSTQDNIARATVDSLCRIYTEKKAAADAAEESALRTKALLIETVQRFGYVPTNAEKSIRLEGSTFVATVTTGATVEIVDAKVTELQLALSRVGKPRLFRQLFDRRTRYSLRKGAAETLQLALHELRPLLPESARTQLINVFSLCFGVSSKSPSLTVEASAAVEAREAKAAAKAAKKAGRK